MRVVRIPAKPWSTLYSATLGGFEMGFRLEAVELLDRYIYTRCSMSNTFFKVVLRSFIPFGDRNRRSNSYVLLDSKRFPSWISRSRKLERSVDFYFTILLGCEDPGVLSLEYSISKFYSSLDRTKLRHFFLPVIQEYIRPVGYFFEPVSLRRFARKGTHRVES